MPLVYRYPVLLVVLLLMAGCGAVRTPEPAAAPEPAEAVETLEEYWPDGSIRIRRQVIKTADGSLVNHGVYARWHKNGKPEYEVLFDRGRKDGQAVRWHMNGGMWIEEFYVLGEKEGACRTWNEAGDLVKEEQFAKGKPHGVWTVWKKGRIKARSCFEYGVPVDCPAETPPE